MFCWNCGKQLADDAKYCNYCGVKVTHIGENGSSFQSQQSVFDRDGNNSYNRLPQVIENRHHSENGRPALQGQIQTYAPLPVQGKNRTNGNRTAFIVLAVLLFFCSFFIGFFYQRNQNSYQHYLDLGISPRLKRKMPAQRYRS